MKPRYNSIKYSIEFNDGNSLVNYVSKYTDYLDSFIEHVRRNLEDLPFYSIKSIKISFSDKEPKNKSKFRFKP
ncbi:MAG: hypothetical protein AABY22_19660 [Nanoarchaeota archaeon]